MNKGIGLRKNIVLSFLGICLVTQSHAALNESTYSREAGDRSTLQYTRDQNGNWTWVVVSGDIEQAFVIKYDRKTEQATLAVYGSDQNPKTARVYAKLNCK